MSVVLLLLAAAAALAFAAFCAGAETGFLSVSRERVLHLAREGGAKAKIVQKALSDMSLTTTTLLIGNNIASVAYSAATTALIADLCSDSAWRSVWSFVAAFIVLYVSEFMPKLLCAARPLRRSLRLARTYAAVETALKPVSWIALRLTDVFMKGRKDVKYKVTSDDLVRILQDRKDGVCLSNLESAIISRIMVLKIKKKPITAEAILSALKEYD